MKLPRLLCLAGAVALAALTLTPPQAPAYIDAPPATLGRMVQWSTHVIQVRVEQVDRAKGMILWRKTLDLKGKWPGGEFLVQQINLDPDTKRHILDWAEAGKTTLMFGLESYRWTHTYIDRCWYAANSSDWRAWNACRPQPQVLRTYCGRADRLQPAILDILNNKQAVVACVAEATSAETVRRKGTLHRLRASLQLLDYNAKRDFVGPGGDEFELQPGMPGFSHRASLPRVGPDAQAISLVDYDGDGRSDICLLGASRLALIQNGGTSLGETLLPGVTGGRAAVWADYNGDGKPDLLVAGAEGPRLFANLGGGAFRDDSKLLPREAAYNLTSAAWLDYDSNGKPDIMLGNGWHGLRLYRNAGPVGAAWRFEDVSLSIGLGPDALGARTKGDTLTIVDVDGDGRADVLYGAGTGLLLLNKPGGFVEAKDHGLTYRTGQVAPVFGDFTFVPQPDGACKLFANDGKGRFTDVTAKAGDLARPIAGATSAAWGDLDNDGRLDLIVGCLKAPNRYFRNNGDGTFTDATEALGLHKFVFNTQAVAVADLNGDGTLDLIFNNEGQDSVVLLGDATRTSPALPLGVRLGGSKGATGAVLRAYDGNKLVGVRDLGASLGRGGQSALEAHLALPAGRYRVEATFASGLKRTQEVTLEGGPAQVVLPAE